MLKSFFVSLFLICLMLWPHSQRPSPNTYSGDYEKANRLYNQAYATEASDSLAHQLYLSVIARGKDEPIPAQILFDANLKAGILEMAQQSNNTALRHFLESIRHQKIRHDITDSILFQPYLYAGSSYYTLNMLDSAQLYYQMAESLFTRYPDIHGSERLFNKAGALYYETGDYTKSLQYFSKALLLLQAGTELPPFLLVTYKNNIASALRKLGRYEEALEIYNGLLPFHFNQEELLHNIGTTYLNSGKYPEAIAQLKKLHMPAQGRYNEIAEAYLQLGLADSAQPWLQNALNLYHHSGITQKNLDYGITLKYSGDLASIKKQTSQALHYYQQAIIQLAPSFSDTAIEKNPQQFLGLQNSFDLFNALVAKARALRQAAADSVSTQPLTMAFDSYIAAIRLVKQVEKTFSSDEARLFLGKNVAGAYQELVSLALQLYKQSHQAVFLQQAFGYAEDSKASVLQAGLQQVQLEKIAGLPTDLIRDEKNLRATIARLQVALNAEADSSKSVSLQKMILDDEIKQAQVQDQLEKNPKYHALRFDSRDISLDSLQKVTLNEREALISYYFLADSLVCFYITREGAGFSIVPQADSIRHSILRFRTQLSDPDLRSNALISQAGARFFAQLLAPCYPAIRDKKHLIIIPHQEINFLPFEVLIDPEKNDYLLNKFAISYHYTANFLQNETPDTHAYSVLALAPFAHTSFSDSLPVLAASGDEIAGLKGKLLIDSQATKQQFLANAATYPVIHLATHAVANDADPLQSYIEFYASRDATDRPHRLYEPEIYQLDLQNTRLIILSACETGSGKLINSEGIMSLSRAFSYAGCKSVITSLWQADDVATAFIGNRLHYYLKKGYEKDEALRMAKLDYISSDQVQPQHKTPAYWAPLLLIGDVSAVSESSHWLFWLVLGVVILTATGIVIKKAGTAKAVPATDKNGSTGVM